MDNTKEILKYNDRSVVEISTDGRVIKYATVTNYDPQKPVGTQWDWGHYYDIYGGVTQEEALRKAILDLYNINENEISSAKSKAFRYDRMEEIGKELAKLYIEVVEDNETLDEATYYLLNNVEITKTEADILGIEDVLYPKKYQIVEVELRREQKVIIKAAVPMDVDVDRYEIEDYISGYDYMEPEDDGDWDIYDVDVLERDVTKEEVKKDYSEEDLWNYGDLNEI